MTNSPLHILLVDNDPANHCLSQVARAELGSIRCELAQSDRLDEALRGDRKDAFDLILLDFPHSAALMVKTLTQLRTKAPGVPIVLLTEHARPTCATTAGEAELRRAIRVQHHEYPLARAIRYAAERSRLKGQLPRQGSPGDLAPRGRRGSSLHAEHQSRTAHASKKPLQPFDGLKHVNDARAAWRATWL